jgi:hypothetical protein
LIILWTEPNLETVRRNAYAAQNPSVPFVSRRQSREQDIYNKHTPIEKEEKIAADNAAVVISTIKNGAPNHTIAGVSPSVYIDMPRDTVEGWLDYEDLYMVQLLSRKQHQLGLTGAVGEIGVHHGLLFIGLALASTYSMPFSTTIPTEPLFAADVFELQKFNFDQSGCGDEQTFLSNVNKYAGRSDVELFKGSSLHLTATMIFAAGKPRARMHSVDGCHTRECTLNDLKIDNDVLLGEGGILLLDDFEQVNPEKDSSEKNFVKGVSTAVWEFVRQQEAKHQLTLVPFWATANKLCLTSPGKYADIYKDEILRKSGCQWRYGIEQNSIPQIG